MSYIGRSSTTGKYHMAMGPNATFCSSSGLGKGSRNRPATELELEKASEISFCKKCFPNGKPTTGARA